MPCSGRRPVSRRPVSSGQLADPVAGTDGAGGEDPGVQAAQPQPAAGPGIEETQRLLAEPGGELGAAQVRLLAGRLAGLRSRSTKSWSPASWRRPGSWATSSSARTLITVSCMPGCADP